MPRYRTETGVVVCVPVEKAQRIGGLTPVDTEASSPRPAAKRPGSKAPRRADQGGQS
ncbi:hypothetical protein [Mycobacteroides abscessus]|jgi:hypothetical protein|uniref:hypothetical protein n=1 Tax=Mycobacteroides abscessus TaxID=36809 RepID=UPI0019D06E8E|nr:hypothetical protein [Mycobacteroides abscessus]MBN7570202.1 hypothetical protein [Mycobacteroides abscessus subsp. abscessus]